MLPRVCLEHVNVHLAGRHVLKDVSWSLEAGDHWAVVGANGSGKSTLLRVIAGTQWIDHDGGRRTYSPDGIAQHVVARAASWIRSVSAEQHERYARLDLPLAGRSIVESGFDNSVYVHRELDARETARVDTLVAELDLERFAHRPLNELSSGQFRRLLIARALVDEPRVLVLDEFTNGLDRVARRDVLAVLDRIAPRVALIVASHRAADFPRAVTQTATVRDGRIATTGAGRPALRTAAARAASPVAADGCREVLLRFRNADVYRGEARVLDGLNWELRRGEHTAIRGANGAGKSTFAGLIAGTLPAATGAYVERFGATGPFDIWRLKERIALVSDDLQIVYDQSDTVEDVIASGFPGSIGLFRTPTAEQRAAADELVGRVGLKALRGRAFTRLSFGERRKVLIARSLVRRPDIFILDEVWNGLDVDFRTALHALLAEMAAAGMTLVVIAHDEDEIAGLATRICSIENGAVHEIPSLEPA